MCHISAQIIIVDDDAAVRDALRFALESEGLCVRLFGSGQDLLDSGPLPDSGCLVIDYNMPGMDGVELVTILRGREVKLPTILIASRLSTELRVRAATSGIKFVLEKPLSDDALMQTLSRALSNPDQFAEN